MPLYGLLEGYFRLWIDSRALLTSCFSAMGYYKIQSGSRTPHYVKFLSKLEMSIPPPVDFISTPVPSQGGDIPGSSSADNWTPYKKSYLYPVSEVIAIITDRSLWRFCGANVEVLSSIVDQKSQYL